MVMQIVITIIVMVLVAPQGLELTAEGVDSSLHFVEDFIHYNKYY